MASAGRDPDFNLEAVDLEALAGMRKRQTERSSCPHCGGCSPHHSRKTGRVALRCPDLRICPALVLHGSHRDSQKPFPACK